MKYAFIEKHRTEFSIRVMCRVMAVSPSGYYGWRGRPPSPRQQRQAARDEQVAQAFAKAKARNGARRLRDDLATDESRPDRKTIGASLARQQLRAKAARKFMATTNSRHGLPVAENLLAQDFTASGPNQKWAGDITYLHTDEGWLYLAVIIDLYSRRVIGWSMGERITAELACRALLMAVSQRGEPRGVIVHSDRGSQYCSAQYQQLLKDYGLRCSMSGKGNCYDNACAESFFHSLKVEAIHGERFASRERMRETVFRYIEVDYNHWRRHSTLGNISPSAFEARMSS